MHRIVSIAAALLTFALPLEAQRGRVSGLARAVDAEVQARARLAQVINDKIFSFGELGFQEIETSAYLTGLLRDSGFTVTEGVSGIPTAWVARWGAGRPVISLGSDIDGIPKASQRPGVAFRDPLVEGAPGHGEGHNAGQAVNVVAALALRAVMRREGVTGTIMLWPGVAEELVASKAWFVRDAMFQDVDAALFTHVGSNLEVSWGQGSGTGLVSVEFIFEGEAAHGAGAPWRGRSALDAVELMNAAWNFRREHMRPLQRSHYVITDGGDQPNVVPSRAAAWYYIREMDYDHIRTNYDAARNIAEAAATMTGTRMTYRILGQAWPRHFNRPIAERMYEHIKAVGLPGWTSDDHALARAVQRLVGGEPNGLDTALDDLGTPPDEPRSGGSDDIGDVSWTVPTVTLRFPSNVPGLPGHHWSSAIAMATPIAHKGVVAGARALARTAIDLFADPATLRNAWTYFRDVQTRDVTYTPFITADDPPPVWLNAAIMAEFRPAMRGFYYDEQRYATYLEQLGVRYPTLEASSGR